MARNCCVEGCRNPAAQSNDYIRPTTWVDIFCGEHLHISPQYIQDQVRSRALESERMGELYSRQMLTTFVEARIKRERDLLLENAQIKWDTEDAQRKWSGNMLQDPFGIPHSFCQRCHRLKKECICRGGFDEGL